MRMPDLQKNQSYNHKYNTSKKRRVIGIKKGYTKLIFLDSTVFTGNMLKIIKTKKVKLEGTSRTAGPRRGELPYPKQNQHQCF